jgi:hypothetical protein
MDLWNNENQLSITFSSGLWILELVENCRMELYVQLQYIPPSPTTMEITTLYYKNRHIFHPSMGY